MLFELLVLEFQMPHFGSIIHNKIFIKIKCATQVQCQGKKPPLVSLLLGKWEENGTITNNRSETPQDGIENPEQFCSSIPQFDHQLFLSNKINNGPMYVCCCCCSTNCVVVVKKAAKNPEKKRDSFLLQLFPSHYDFTIILIQMYFSRKTFLKAKHVYWNTFEINNFNRLIFK